MIQQVQKAVLEKTMNRKEFFSYTGSVFLMLIGVTGVIKALTASHPTRQNGYGAQYYGGPNRKKV